jgi:valyl-tRNA synthetase
MEPHMHNDNNIPEALLKPYSAKEVEGRIYAAWEESGFFNPDVCVEKGVTAADAEPFSIVLPPPNVTGTLHTGHALMLAIEDVMVRFARMQGKRTLWIPGTDHAAIATQSKVEKILEKEEGKRKSDLGREEFLKRVEKFASDSHDTIVGQARRMGASLDWSREAFTLDEKRSFAVRTAFKRMYDEGLIYRGHRIVNWDPKGQTVISDDEIVYEERKAKLYTFKYSKDFPISISTTRPETKIGDTAVAVAKDDERYAQFIGKEYDAIFCGVPIHIKIVADESVEKEYGTGALGVTPAHSQIDAEIAQRHGLPTVQVINEYAKMMLGGENLLGKKTTEAREVIVQWLRDEGLMEGEEDISQNISTAERTGAIIEPLPKLQWFINVNKPIDSHAGKTLKDLMLAPFREGKITIMPENFERVYMHWIENLRDWCISRQIWYGHRIPVWYKGEEIFVGVEAPDGEGWTQDEDSLDTWFSSGLWTFSTLGWPEQTPDFKTYHPTSVLETGYDILPFWVARMILMSTYLLNDVPFKTVYFHGLVRDEKGRKMSKSLGNIVDPITLIEKYGTDALRMAMIVGVGPGNDSNLGEDKIKAYSKFANKLWNIERFVLENTASLDATKPLAFDAEDAASLEDLQVLLKEITQEMEEFKFYLVAEKLYHYAWHTFADVIIERCKAKIAAGGSEAESAQQLLITILSLLLKALHPFMPFLTEELWAHAGHDTMLMVESWPAKS